MKGCGYFDEVADRGMELVVKGWNEEFISLACADKVEQHAKTCKVCADWITVERIAAKGGIEMEGEPRV